MSVLAGEELVAAARALAESAHAGFEDKAGRPYFEHVADVARTVEERGYGPEVVAAAWLHDVVEDARVTLDDLRSRRFPEVVVVAVDALTRRVGERYLAYVARAAENRTARPVKRADNDGNSRAERLALLPPATAASLGRRYARARDVLDEADAADRP